VVVAEIPDRFVRRVMDQVVGHPVADARTTDRRLVHAMPAAVMVNVVVFRVETGRRERLPVAALERHAAHAGLGDVATGDALPAPPSTVTAQAPVLRSTHRPTRLSMPPLSVTAVERQASRMNPRIVTWSVSSISTSESRTETTARPAPVPSADSGGQK